MLTFFPKGIWRYAVLIILLFAIVAVASMFIIQYLGEHIPDPKYEQTIWELSVSIWTLTMGCLFLAGAFGLWAIRSTAENESFHRLGRFVDTMDYLTDGLLVLDKKGRIAGSNPALKQLAPGLISERAAVTFQELFSSLTEQDNAYLLKAVQPREIVRNCIYPNGLRTLRFRSQSSEGVILVLVSDVTEIRSNEIRQKQIAQLQLVGRIAGGVAHDFNNILCAISGHSALLKRLDMTPEAVKKSIDIIARETQRGELLSRQLLELSHSGGGGRPTFNLDKDIEEVGSLLRVALSPEWEVKTVIHGKYSAVPLTTHQVEQVVLNLGLLAADAQMRPGIVMITLNKPGQGNLLDVGNEFAAVILISAEISASEKVLQDNNALGQALPVRDEAGVIMSVVRSLVEEAGGRIDHLTAPGGLCVYRVCLPHLDSGRSAPEQDLFADSDLSGYLSRWHVLLSGTSIGIDALDTRLSVIGTAVERKNTVASLLACIQSVQDLDVMVLDKQTLGSEADILLSAIQKLSPHLGIVVLCKEPEKDIRSLPSVVALDQHTVDPQQIIHAMISAKSMKADRPDADSLHIS